MRLVGLIPARGGSKGIPGKNIAPCAGRPLLAWTCTAALESGALSRTILSTDAEEIARVGKACGVEVPFMRPAALARDDTPSLDVMQHALEWIERGAGPVDAIVLLQPTSPLRRAQDIDGAAALFSRGGADTVVSVVDVPHRYHPQAVLREKDGALVPYGEAGRTVISRHALEPLLARNGPAVLIVSRATLKNGQLYGARTLAYRMRDEDSIDIDSPDDLRLASLLLEARQRK
jgi:CMP-N,N'-diacetyllegionaminic acid synthase